LRQSDLYRDLFQALDDPCSIVQVVYDGSRQAVDCRLVAANRAFEGLPTAQPDSQQRLHELCGTLTPGWVQICGEVALTGGRCRVGSAGSVGDRRYVGYAYRVGVPEDRQVALVFRDVTDRAREEEGQIPAGESVEQRVALQAEELGLLQERVRTLAQDLSLAEQRERKRLAAELHEDLAERLVVARVKLGQLHQTTALEASSEELLKEADTILARALTYTRSIVGDLSPLVLQDLGLPAAVRWLAGRMQQHGLAVTVQATLPDPLVLPDAQTVFLFQAIRELLLNTLKHANCRGASVLLAGSAGMLQAEVYDDGEGFQSTSTGAAFPPSPFGLSGIAERINAFGGTFEIHSRPQEGTRAILRLPLEAAPQEATAEPEVKADASRGRDAHGGIIRVLLVDDHAMVRQGLRSVLDAYADMKVVGEAADGETAVRLTGELLPTVVLMDINMPVCNGIEATKRIKARYPRMQIIGLSVDADDQNQDAMLKAGAYSLMTKEAAVDQLYALIYEAVKPGVTPFRPLR
jgi:signal transduction histidine kinase/CheY-like chemotaxis protein